MPFGMPPPAPHNLLEKRLLEYLEGNDVFVKEFEVQQRFSMGTTLTIELYVTPVSGVLDPTSFSNRLRRTLTGGDDKDGPILRAALAKALDEGTDGMSVTDEEAKKAKELFIERDEANLTTYVYVKDM